MFRCISKHAYTHAYISSEEDSDVYTRTELIEIGEGWLYNPTTQGGGGGFAFQEIIHSRQYRQSALNVVYDSFYFKHLWPLISPTLS